MEIEPIVLYVEDDSRSRRVMKMMLVNRLQLPYVTIFEDSEDFLARVEALDPKPDLLRDSDTFADTTVVALTASVMNEEVNQLKESGFDGCLAKPIDSDTFPEVLSLIAQGETIWHITA